MPIQGYNTEIAKELSLSAAVLYNQLAFWSDKGKRDDGWVYKKHSELAEELAISEKVIMLSYQKLEEAGYIETMLAKVSGAPVKHFRLRRKVDFHFDERSKTMDFDERSKSYKEHKTTINNVHDAPASLDGYKQSGSEKSGKPEIVPDGGNTPAAAPSLDLLKAVIEIVNPREKPTDDRLRNVRARMKDYTNDEILLAAMALSKSQWHRDNGQMSVDNLIRASKFGRWYQASLDAKPTMTRAERNAAVLAELRAKR